ncbi:MAG: hypothetical protein Q7Q71_09235 [Verrucomicrobiota bacterium JB023]|nr:hypothetical protein [Verrucomicrobiota bacterium JB023]
MKALAGGFSLAAIIPVLAQQPLCEQMMHGPVLETPGTATCLYDAATSTAIITMNDETVLRWDDMQQSNGDALQFNFLSNVNNASVLNRLGDKSLGSHQIGGEIISNGRVIFYSPGAALDISATVNATEFIAVNAPLVGGDDLGLLKRQTVQFGTPSRRQPAVGVSGAQIKATTGDIVIGGSTGVIISDSSTELQAGGSVRLFGGTELAYRPNGEQAFFPSGDGKRGVVTNFGSIEAGSIEMQAASSVINEGSLTADGRQQGSGRIYLQVENGRIFNRSNGTVAGIVVANEVVDSKGTLLNPQDADTVAVAAPSTGLFPALRESTDRKSKRTKAVEVVKAAPTVASARANPTQGTSPNRQNRSNTRALVSRSAFFGLRGKAKPQETEQR